MDRTGEVECEGAAGRLRQSGGGRPSRRDDESGLRGGGPRALTVPEGVAPLAQDDVRVAHLLYLHHRQQGVRRGRGGRQGPGTTRH